MKQFNFPYHTQSTEYPESGTRVQLGNSYVFTAPPSGPDMRRFRLSFPTMLYVVNDEATATNYLKNSSASGLNAGAIPGWNPVRSSDITTTLVGTGYDSDQEPYVDIRISGTNSSGSTQAYGISFDDPATFPAASSGQVWAASIGVVLVSGSVVSSSLPQVQVIERNNSGAGVAVTATTISLSSLSNKKRYSSIKTFSNANTAKAAMSFYINVATGNSVDVTFRVSLPQLERDRVTSPIWTTTGPVTRTQGTLSSTLRYPVNLKALEDFYNEHKMHKSFLYPHPVYGNVECKFFSPLKIPEGLPGGNGAVKDFTIELIEVP